MAFRTSDLESAKALARSFGAGFWSCNNQYFFNKAEALFASNRSGHAVQYQFFDEVYSKVKRPDQSLDELYDIRAQQIRLKYSYVALCCSGGADSTNMLMAFLRQGLLVDEIIAYYPIEGNSKLTFDGTDNAYNHQFEYDYALTPLLKHVEKISPQTKITILDYTKKAIELVDGNQMNKFYPAGFSVHVGSAGTHMVLDYISKWDRANATCVIGVDKPRIMYSTRSNMYYFFFIDFQNFWPCASMAYDVKIEQFYYSPDLPEIIWKQYFKVRELMGKIMYTPLYDELWRPHNDKNYIHLYNMQEEFFEDLIYPSLKQRQYQSKKPDSIFYNEESKWFYESVPYKTMSFYTGQMKEFLIGIDPNDIVHTPDGRVAQFKHISSQMIGAR